MENIEYNRVTWYSKLLAIIVFLLIIPAVSFYLGRKYQETVSTVNPAGDTDFTTEAPTDLEPGGFPVEN